MPTLLFQLITITADIAFFIFIGYYFLKYRAKEKELQIKEGKVDTEYHRIVDDALSKERKILEDASAKAQQIISNTQYVNDSSKDLVNKALQKMILDVEKEALDTARSYLHEYQESIKQLSATSLADFQNAAKAMQQDQQKQQQIMNEIHTNALKATKDFTDSYQSSIKQLSLQSLNDFQTIAHELETNLQKQIKEFHDTLLPNLEKEVEVYRQERLKQAEHSINGIIQKVSQEVLNKSFSIDDHQNLMIQALEKAKKEGVFD